jgi:hypothetical protein
LTSNSVIDMYRVTLFILMFSLVIGLLSPIYVLGQAKVSSVNGLIVYSLEDNTGIVTMNFTFTEPLANTTIDLPLFSNNIIEIINVTSGSGEQLMYSYYSGNHTVSILITDSPVSRITVSYLVSSMFQEIGVNAYTSILDLTNYTDYTVNITLILMGRYNVSVDPAAEVIVGTDTTTIILDDPTIYTIVIYEIPTPPTPASPTTTAATTTPITGTTTSPEATGTATTSPETTTGGSPAKTTTGGAAGGGGFSTTLIVTIIIVIIIVVVIVILYMRR